MFLELIEGNFYNYNNNELMVEFLGTDYQEENYVFRDAISGYLILLFPEDMHLLSGELVEA